MFLKKPGRVSVASNGKLQVGVTKEELKKILEEEQNKTKQEKQKVKRKLWKGLVKNEESLMSIILNFFFADCHFNLDCCEECTGSHVGENHYQDSGYYC